MFERFTEHARRAVVGAAHEAGERGSATFDTGDLLAALAGDPGGVARRALILSTVAVEEVPGANRKVAPLDGAGSDDPMAPDAKLALQAAADAAIVLGQPAVGTGHLLLAVLEGSDTRAPALLTSLGVDPDLVARNVEDLIREGARDDDRPTRVSTGHRAAATGATDVVATLLSAWEPVVHGAAADHLAGLQAIVTQPPGGASVGPWAPVDWLVRTNAPAWLDAIGEIDEATRLRNLIAVDSPATAVAAGTALDAVAGRLAELVPPPIRASDRASAEADLALARAAAGEDAARTSATHDIPTRVHDAAAAGVAAAMADLVRGHLPVADLWDRSLTAAQRAASGDRRPSGIGGARRAHDDTGGGVDAAGTAAARMIAMRAVRRAAGPAAIPLTLLEAGLRSARSRRARERIEDQAARAALVACCRQVVSDAVWMIDAPTDGSSTAHAVVAGQQASLLALLASFLESGGVSPA